MSNHKLCDTKSRKIIVRVFYDLRDPIWRIITVECCVPQAVCISSRVANELTTVRNTILKGIIEIVSNFKAPTRFQIVFQWIPHELRAFAHSLNNTSGEPADDKLAQAWVAVVDKGGHLIDEPHITSVS